MKHLLFFLTCLFITSVSSVAQSAITVSLDGGNPIFTGAQLKYTHAFKTFQLGAFVTPTASVIDDFDYLTRFGICVNSVAADKKDVSMYGGFAAEGYLDPKKSRTFTDKAIMVGLHLGVNVKLRERLYLNSEWGFRGGFLFTQGYQQSPGAASHGYPGTYYEDRVGFIYFPASIGVSYVFGRGKGG